MKQKTFFLVTAVIIIIMATFFTLKLLSLPATGCLPEFDFDCEVRAISMCSFDLAAAILFHSWCEGDTCWGEWEVYCEKEPGIIFVGFIDCSDLFNAYCENN